MKNQNKGILVLLSLAFVTTVTYFIYTVVTSSNIINQLSSIIGVSILSIFAICFVFMGLSNEDKKGRTYVILASLLLTCYSGFQVIDQAGLLTLPKQKTVLDFSNKSLVELQSWAKGNNISIEQVFESSDNVENYHIISQDVTPGTLVKKVKKMKVTISNGPNLEKEVLIPSMLGWNADDVLAFIEENFLSNVEVSFIFSEEARDTLISQEGSGNLKRSDKIVLVFSLGRQEELTPIKMPNLVNKSLFYSTFFLKRNAISYDLAYDYSDTIHKDYTMAQSVEENTSVTPMQDTVTLTISKGSKIVVPNLLTMSNEEITRWAIEHNLKMKVEDCYDDTVKLGYPIEVNVKENDVIEEGFLLHLVLSRGPLKMEDFTSIAEFKTWAEKYGILYQEEQVFDRSVPLGTIIKYSHNSGDIIKNGEKVTVTVSQGKAITIPNFVGKTKSKIQSECSSLNISCSFSYGGYSDSIARDVATRQSKQAGSEVVEGTSLAITLSSGIVTKVSVPEFYNKSQGAIQQECNNLGLTCSFQYASNYSSIAAGNALNQSVASGTQVVQGTNVLVTLSIGPAQSFTGIRIQSTLLVPGNPEASKQAILSYLTSKCPGVTFNITFKKDVSGNRIGLIHEDSPIGGDPQTYTQGNSYTIIIAN